jgi:hypothetical protein
VVRDVEVNGGMLGRFYVLCLYAPRHRFARYEHDVIGFVMKGKSSVRHVSSYRWTSSTLYFVAGEDARVSEPRASKRLSIGNQDLTLFVLRIRHPPERHPPNRTIGFKCHARNELRTALSCPCCKRIHFVL